MSLFSLKKRAHKLSKQKEQLALLSSGDFANGTLLSFKDQLQKQGKEHLTVKPLEVLQLNLGYMCNQVCKHCHVDAGPDRKEIMSKETLQYVLKVLKKHPIHTIDLTGGAPEMNPNFRWFIQEVSKLEVKDIIVRSNLTILRANKKYYDLPDFFKEHGIHVVSSMPHWSQEKTDRQRGDGVFNASIEALKELNKRGYGKSNTSLKLDLVYNPSGAFLPSEQLSLEKDFKKSLFKDFGIEFNQLFVLTNLPISRFLEYLIASGNYEEYMYSLVEAFNPRTIDNVMCTNTLSIDWEGYLYDCDFNQMLGLKAAIEKPHIKDFNSQALLERTIKISQHCYGCTAGAGSSCQGTIA